MALPVGFPAGIRRSDDGDLRGPLTRVRGPRRQDRAARGRRHRCDQRTRCSLHVEMLRAGSAIHDARTLRRSPGFAFTAVARDGAIAVGANTAAFSVADFVLIRPLVVSRLPNRLIRLCAGPRNAPAGWGCNNQLSPADYRDFREQSDVVRGAGRVHARCGEPGRRRRAGSASHRSAVTPDVLPLLRVQPLLGSLPRTLTLMRRRHACGQCSATASGSHDSEAAQDVVGRTVSLDGVSHTVDGRDAAGLPFSDVGTWSCGRRSRLIEDDFVDRGNNYLEAVAPAGAGCNVRRVHAPIST